MLYVVRIRIVLGYKITCVLHSRRNGFQNMFVVFYVSQGMTRQSSYQM
jgi:hypothetical protein